MKTRRVSKPYECDICLGRFKRVSGLLGHKRFRHNDLSKDAFKRLREAEEKYQREMIKRSVLLLKREFFRLERALYESDLPQDELELRLESLRNKYLFRILAAREGLLSVDD